MYSFDGYILLIPLAIAEKYGVPISQTFQTRRPSLLQCRLQFKHALIADFLIEIEIDLRHRIVKYQITDFFHIVTVFLYADDAGTQATFEQYADGIVAAPMVCGQFFDRATIWRLIDAFQLAPLACNPGALKDNGAERDFLCFKACIDGRKWLGESFALHCVF